MDPNAPLGLRDPEDSEARGIAHGGGLQAGCFMLFLRMHAVDDEGAEWDQQAQNGIFQRTETLLGAHICYAIIDPVNATCNE